MNGVDQQRLAKNAKRSESLERILCESYEMEADTSLRFLFLLTVF